MIRQLKESFPSKVKVLVVDDDLSFWNFAIGILDDWQVKVLQELQSREKVVSLTFEFNPDVVIVSSLVQDFDWEWFCSFLKGIGIKVILLGRVDDLRTKSQGFLIGVDDFVTKPLDVLELKIRVKNLFEAKLYQEFRSVIEETGDTSLEAVYHLATIAEFRDQVTSLHVQRVERYAMLIGVECGLSREALRELRYGAILHDVGKLGIPDRILLKPGSLTQEEWEVMKKHPIIGADFLERSLLRLLDGVGRVVLYHHERWDGNGYPSGLKGEQIPLFARIIAIADVFDALTSDRPYRRALSSEEAFEVIANGRGAQFDPDLVDLFLSLKDEVLFIKEFLSEGNTKRN